MQFSQRTGKRQSNTCAGNHLSIFLPIKTDKWFEYFLLHCIRYDRPIIHCPNMEYSILHSHIRFQENLYIALCILHGIAQQITEYLGKSFFIDMRVASPFRYFQSEIQFFLFGKRSKSQMCLLYYFRYIASSEIQTESLTFSLAKIQ